MWWQELRWMGKWSWHWLGSVVVVAVVVLVVLVVVLILVMLVMLVMLVVVLILVVLVLRPTNLRPLRCFPPPLPQVCVVCPSLLDVFQRGSFLNLDRSRCQISETGKCRGW